MITQEQVLEIIVKLTQIDERQKALDEASDHRHNNLKMSLDGLASKKDVETANERIVSLRNDHDEKIKSLKDSHDKRITALESNQSRVVWALLGTMGSVVINMLGLTKKFGF